YRDLAPGARRVHEVALAQVDADVVDAALAASEEHQVAGRELAAVDDFASARHVARDARQVDADGRAEHVADQPAAIEAVGGGAAPAVGRAQQRQRTLDHLVDAFGGGGAGIGLDCSLDAARGRYVDDDCSVGRGGRGAVGCVPGVRRGGEQGEGGQAEGEGAAANRHAYSTSVSRA